MEFLYYMEIKLDSRNPITFSWLAILVDCVNTEEFLISDFNQL
jgi:hypothetical protein